MHQKSRDSGAASRVSLIGVLPLNRGLAATFEGRNVYYQRVCREWRLRAQPLILKACRVGHALRGSQCIKEMP